ncbi:response regulator transcription factor [Litoreibacter janthinus]|uniref:Two-component system, OmpR family, response regulator n=1 Tax=Litoreibacter janthinus TaxID=670154 RepID=A0A1I6FX27_9RHOB|nr:response regulator transcription factor [Litoreibacter janthinus]SFR34460.1 two-component system, OmpR family, response regulator [Litoreibacter janthinus]
MRITLVEDNISLAKGIAYRLQDAGHAVDMLHDGLEAEVFLKDDASDLIILDINLPGQDGLALLKGLRQRGDMRPVILLTARAETEDRVIGLDAGADDYLIKPFEAAELEARVRALSRRRAVPQRQLQSFGQLTLDVGSRQLFAGDVEIDLPRRELSVIEALLSADGRLVSKNALLDHAYGVGADVEDKVVEVYISRLRQRLKPFGVKIKAQRGLGYQLLIETV